MKLCCCATWPRRKTASRIRTTLTRNTRPATMEANAGVTGERLKSASADDRPPHFSVGLSTTMFASAPGTSCPCCGRPAARAGFRLRRGLHPAGSIRQIGSCCARPGPWSGRCRPAFHRVPMNRAAAVFHFHLDGAELVGAVGHAGCGGGVGDENGAFECLWLAGKA
jgi:hypothetical protein